MNHEQISAWTKGDNVGDSNTGTLCPTMCRKCSVKEVTI